MRIKAKRLFKSRTINWGHLQVALGAVGAGLGYVTPGIFAGLPTWAYGLAAIGAGVITYVLRAKTVEPLADKLGKK